MRLTYKEQHAIKSVLLNLDSAADIYLYGSRVDPSLKGGDIDLMVISEKLSWSDKLTALTEIKEKIGDQKIDLLICKKSLVSSDPFVQSILKHAVPL